MKKKLFKWVVIPAVTFMSACALTSFASAGEGSNFHWATYMVIDGIHLCDGPPLNCGWWEN